MNIFDQKLHNSLSSVILHQELDRQFNSLLNSQDRFDPAKIMLLGVEEGLLHEDVYSKNILADIIKQFTNRYKNYPKDRANIQSEYKFQMNRYYDSLSDGDKARMKSDLGDIKSSMGRENQESNLGKLVKQYKELYKSNLYKMTKKMVEGGLLGGGMNTKTPQGRNMQKVILSLYDKVSKSIDNWNPTLAKPGDNEVYDQSKSPYYSK